MSYDDDDISYTEQEIVLNSRPLVGLVKRDFSGRKVFECLDECVLQSRIAGAEKAQGDLQRAHHFQLKEAERTWRHSMRGQGTGSVAGGVNPLREFFDQGMTVSSASRIFGYQAIGQECADGLLNAAKLFEQYEDRHPFLALCALRLRLCAACYNQEQTAKYLALSMHALRQLDDFLEVPYPPRPHWKLALNRKRAPKRGWATAVISRAFRSSVTQEETLRMLLKPLKPKTSVQIP
jgi:hypothetical protein